jgi:hypothetical protein
MLLAGPSLKTPSTMPTSAMVMIKSSLDDDITALHTKKAGASTSKHGQYLVTVYEAQRNKPHTALYLHVFDSRPQHIVCDSST